MCHGVSSGNSIGVVGATALASALEKSNTLQNLDVSSEWRDAGVCVFVLHDVTVDGMM